MKSDKAALQHALKRLGADEATLKSDTASGRMSAKSKDAMKVFTQDLADKSEKKDIAIGKEKVAR